MKPTRALTITALVVALMIPLLTRVVRSLRMTRGAVATFTRLVGSANAHDLTTVRTLCTTRYQKTHPIERAAEGGVVGLPRTIHKNFQAWTENEEVYLCPTDRVGPVYRFIQEAHQWKFDGPMGLLRARKSRARREGGLAHDHEGDSARVDLRKGQSRYILSSGRLRRFST